MEYLLDITLQNRKLLHKLLTETPREQLFEIPQGFNNNIWWNIAHVVVTQQLLVYKLSNLQMRVDDDMVEAYRKGTFPKGEASDEEVKMVAALLFSTLEWFKEDYDNGLFKEFNSYTTSVNVTLHKVEDSIAFNTFHEGIHLGAILALKRAVQQ
ncbi:DinB family protein [Sediminicola sp. 1XM1-17]|uniref:DinB family protein n=1 Tax=Sediminicola sp. 1XM1-17 TaxID=3127702 RepID=UPI003077B201